jgi:hypothetical protein
MAMGSPLTRAREFHWNAAEAAERAESLRMPVWIAWPKKPCGRETDLTQQGVKDTGLAAGLVDHKICAIGDVWSGTEFSRRKSGD